MRPKLIRTGKYIAASCLRCLFQSEGQQSTLNSSVAVLKAATCGANRRLLSYMQDSTANDDPMELCKERLSADEKTQAIKGSQRFFRQAAFIDSGNPSSQIPQPQFLPIARLGPAGQTEFQFLPTPGLSLEANGSHQFCMKPPDSYPLFFNISDLLPCRRIALTALTPMED